MKLRHVAVLLVAVMFIPTLLFAGKGGNGERAGILVEYGKTQDIFLNPVDRRTEDYISGRFG